MSTTAAPASSPTATAPRERRRRPLRRAAAVAAMSAALLGGAAASAQAVNGYLYPGQSTAFGTNWWGTSEICVKNYSGSVWGQYRLRASGAPDEYVWVPPYGLSCRNAWWWGTTVYVANSGSTLEYVYRSY